MGIPTYLPNFRKINCQRKHLIRLICNNMKYESVIELHSSLNMLNVYQVNIINNA